MRGAVKALSAIAIIGLAGYAGKQLLPQMVKAKTFDSGTIKAAASPVAGVHEVARVTMEARIAEFVGNYPNWVMKARAHPHEHVRLYFMLRRSAETRKLMEDTLMAVSTPGDPRYGRHLTKAEAQALSPPLPGSREAVIAWLEYHGVKGDGMVKEHSGIIDVTMSVETAEEMLQTTLHHFAHNRAAKTQIRASSSYSVPENVAWALYLVGDLVQLAAIDTPPTTHNSPGSFSAMSDEAGEPFPGDCGYGCEGYVTPGVLHKAYNVPVAPRGQNTTMSISQFQGVSWDSSDLKVLSQKCNLDVPATVAEQDGFNNYRYCSNILLEELCFESLLDISYIKAMAGDVPLTVISLLDYSLLAWAVHVLNEMDDPPPLHSVSYGDDEVQQVSEEFAMATNDLFMLMGIQGMSVLFASGDQGVYGRTGRLDWDYGRFHPDFPASSPYITAVGGTDFATQGVIGEEESWIASGGGFSDFFEMPAYQAAAVSEYLGKDDASMPPQARFNAAGRGYPDVAALGGVRNPYCIAVHGLFGFITIGIGGTSASCPTVAGMFAQINAQRAEANLPPMGFLNPFIYQNPGVFKDVTLGINKGNNSEGFEGFPALEGWDPATGMGTVNFPALAAAALNFTPWGCGDMAEVQTMV